jgi:ParB family chromosome partitioning protein
MKHEEVPMAKISVGERHRKDAGDIEGLAANIREMGLLQPIGLDRYYHLIFGERRLLACQILNWEKMPCIILDLESVLAGEYAENEFRKQFTPSERAAIGRAVEAELGAKERRGGDQKSKGPIGPNAEKGRTADIAAKKAGFTDRKSYQRAQDVVDRGTPELIAAMDKGEIKIDAAAKIASQPKAEQQRIVAMPKDERREVVKRIRDTKAEQAANEARARDIYLYRGLHDAVKFIAEFTATPEETWPGISRVSAWAFPENLDRALDYLTRLRKGHPNALRQPQTVAKSS